MHTYSTHNYTCTHTQITERLRTVTNDVVHSSLYKLVCYGIFFFFWSRARNSQKPINIIISGVLLVLEIQPGPHRVIGTIDGKHTLTLDWFSMVPNTIGNLSLLYNI